MQGYIAFKFVITIGYYPATRNVAMNDKRPVSDLTQPLATSFYESIRADNICLIGKTNIILFGFDGTVNMLIKNLDR